MRLPRAVALSAGALLAISALAGCTGAPDGGPSTTPSAAPTGTSVYDLEVGDCFTADLGALLEFVDVQDCASPHEYEVYASLLEPDGDFPGGNALEQDAQDRCTSSFADFVGIRYENSKLTINFLSPTRADWEAGNRSVLCFLSEPGEELAGSARQSAR